ncbi:MAG: hypothetical protein DRP56_08285 [Planctomycetota bacterium]|nr:MAG: hypothetical protein DRP56_08285 [Planctomycetota bacterium]
MNLKEHLAELAEKIQSGCGPTISYYEVRHWPKGRLEELIEMGVLAKAMYAKRITCTDCAKGECSGIEPTIETIQETGETAGFFLCSKGGGLKKVSEKELQQWVIVAEKLPISKKQKAVKETKRNRPTQSEMENRNRTIAMAAAEIKLKHGRLPRVDEIAEKTKLDPQQIYASAPYKDDKIAKASAKVTEEVTGSSVQKTEYYGERSEEHGRQNRRSKSDQAELDATIDQQKEDDESNFVTI